MQNLLSWVYPGFPFGGEGNCENYSPLQIRKKVLIDQKTPLIPTDLSHDLRNLCFIHAENL